MTNLLDEIKSLTRSLSPKDKAISDKLIKNREFDDLLDLVDSALTRYTNRKLMTNDIGILSDDRYEDLTKLKSDIALYNYYIDGDSLAEEEEDDYYDDPDDYSAEDVLW